MNIKQFQKDLQTLTLEQTLKKHNTTLKEALNKIPLKRTTPKNNPLKYIVKKGEDYYIQKTVNGKTETFNHYPTLKQAIQVRDKLIKCNWNKKNLKIKIE